MARLVKDKLEILSCFTAVKRASSSHDNMQSLFILLEDNLTVLPWPDTTHHVLLDIVLHAELLLDSENHWEVLWKIACHVETAKG